MEYSSNNSTWSTSIPTGTTASNYTSYWRIVGHSNHNDKGFTSIVTRISAKTVSSPTILLNPSSYTYSGGQCKPTPTVKDGDTVISSIEYTVSYENNINAGTTAKCIITDNEGGNYVINGDITYDDGTPATQVYKWLTEGTTPPKNSYYPYDLGDGFTTFYRNYPTSAHLFEEHTTIQMKGFLNSLENRIKNGEYTTYKYTGKKKKRTHYRGQEV